MSLVYNPPDGYRNVTDFPTKPPSEAAFRDSMQDLLDQIRDYINGIDPWGSNTTVTRSSVRAYQSTSQTLSANVSAKVNFQTAIYDNLSEFNTSLSRFTASHGGHYLIIAGISIPNLASSARFLLNVAANGTENVRIYDSIIPANNVNSIAAGSCIISLGVNEFIELQAFSNVTFAIEGVPTKTIFEVIRIA